eukprot:TRINITY_DN4633_c0_g1_i1.p1 TRINITY_DN4633_c0_g1~~TRINITY_DN4633_c0_g1_i1.p1  ORF type:complete len:232 (-),score=49.70 TRINITY_DN4633_c0_g1_i1:170-865(-)
MVVAIVLQSVVDPSGGGENLFFVTDRKLSPSHFQYLTKHFRTELENITSSDLHNSAGPRSSSPNYQQGRLTLPDGYEVQYYRLNEIYVSIYCRASHNPFMGYCELDRTKEMLTKLCRGVDVSVAFLLKKYAEVYLALTYIIDGIDIGHVDFGAPKIGVTDISSAVHSNAVLTPRSPSKKRVEEDDTQVTSVNDEFVSDESEHTETITKVIASFGRSEGIKMSSFASSFVPK